MIHTDERTEADDDTVVVGWGFFIPRLSKEAVGGLTHVRDIHDSD